MRQVGSLGSGQCKDGLRDNLENCPTLELFSGQQRAKFGRCSASCRREATLDYVSIALYGKSPIRLFVSIHIQSHLGWLIASTLDLLQLAKAVGGVGSAGPEVSSISSFQRPQASLATQLALCQSFFVLGCLGLSESTRCRDVHCEKRETLHLQMPGRLNPLLRS